MSWHTAALVVEKTIARKEMVLPEERGEKVESYRSLGTKIFCRVDSSCTLDQKRLVTYEVPRYGGYERDQHLEQFCFETEMLEKKG
jgi:hypothetical protein